ncbi:hypothetical protein F3Y22_tig00111027pilonHSYRG00688 [Hibiscus syriacus]|uniref:Uncharacterized protein n=1 Tax=Hibiscus syriacus TaxID=106335 RepID=A0A6A2Z5Y0_HIBSY|nr:hypothetical protein F3Y22_tig00111027pilonHSYRG00688 [Hibiscus syriacus]
MGATSFQCADTGEVHTWVWKECVPLGEVTLDLVTGQVWGWGYGGEDEPPAVQGTLNSQVQLSKAAESYVKEITCRGRHSAFHRGYGLHQDDSRLYFSDMNLVRLILVANAGAVLTFGWGYMDRYNTFGGNQFGQLGTGAEQAETSPKRLDAAILEGKHAKKVSCGARHSTVLKYPSLSVR